MKLIVNGKLIILPGYSSSWNNGKSLDDKINEMNGIQLDRPEEDDPAKQKENSTKRGKKASKQSIE